MKKLKLQPKLTSLEENNRNCRRCKLCQQRKRVVFGEGDGHASLIFVGEGPGAEEDKKGRPFVGRAGELLNKMIAAMGMDRKEVYITNVVKCRPPKNRQPTEFESKICRSNFLDQEISIIQPQIICALGTTAAQAILNTDETIGKLRGRFHKVEYIDVMPTYHPAFLLRKAGKEGKIFKKRVWQDLQMIMTRLYY
jgi:DNA polymerase